MNSSQKYHLPSGERWKWRTRKSRTWICRTNISENAGPENAYQWTLHISCFQEVTVRCILGANKGSCISNLCVIRKCVENALKLPQWDTIAIDVTQCRNSSPLQNGDAVAVFPTFSPSCDSAPASPRARPVAYEVLQPGRQSERTKWRPAGLNDRSIVYGLAKRTKRRRPLSDCTA